MQEFLQTYICIYSAHAPILPYISYFYWKLCVLFVSMNVFNATSDNVDDNWRDFIEGFLLAISFSSYPIVYRHPSNVMDDEWTQFKFIDRLMYRWYTSLSFCYTIIILKYLSNRLLHRHRLFFLWRFLLLLLLEIIISWIFLPFFLDLFFLTDVYEDYYADPFTSNSSLYSYVF